jgi:hypothetical protein
MAPIEFTDRELRLIAKALPENADERRLALFPEIMRDWGRTDLPHIIRIHRTPPRCERSVISASNG